MGKLAFHCKKYRVGALNGIDRHNRRLTHGKSKSNPDINTDKSKDNIIYIQPDKSLFLDCKEQIERRVENGRITKASNWICECIFTYSSDLPNERLDEYNELIIKYMIARLGRDNIRLVVCHKDEIGLPHLHIDVLMITEDGRLCAKNIIDREFIQSIHDGLPYVLQVHGFNVERGENVQDKSKVGRDTKKYKKDIEIEKDELDKKFVKLVDDYNLLVDDYNKLLYDKQLIKEENREKLKTMLNDYQESR